MTGGSSVEDEILSLKLDNTQFEHAASTSMSTFDKLKSSLSSIGGSVGKELSSISGNIRGFNMNPLVDSASEVSKAFSSMSVVAISAIATLASEATQAGLGIVKSLSISPITEGFGEYDTTLGSIQTILSNTGLEGKKGLATVNKSLQELNHYSDKTIYNFTQMAKNIGTFTAAGVGLDESTAAIKGIANLAAVSGSTADQASTAMYQLSQALASGTVKLMDWNSVVNAGMGGKVFKDSIMETARAHGVAIDDMIKKDGSFRDTLQEGWFTSDILTETLSKFTGDLSRAQLKAQGYTKKEIDNIIHLGKMANDAATKVKTIPQLFDTLKEAVGSGWTLTFQQIFGNFSQAKATFTDLSNYLGGIVKQSAKQRNSMLKDWGKLHGRTVLIKAVKHAWEALMSVLGPIRDAFREIFPPETGKQLFHLTQAVNHFFKALVLSKDAQENLKNTFAGLFAVIHIAFTVISGIAHLLGTLIGLFFKSQGSTLAFTGGIGKMLVALDKFLTKGKFVEKFFNLLATVLTGILGPLVDVKNGLVNAFVGLITGDPAGFFNGISDAISGLLGLVDNLSNAFADVVNSISDAMGGIGHIHGLDLSSMFGGASADGARKGIDGIKGDLSGLGTISQAIKNIWDEIIKGFSSGGKKSLDGIAGTAQGIKNIWDGVLGVFHSIGDFLKPLTSQFGSVFSAIHDQFSNLFSGRDINFNDVLKAINTGLFLAIFVQITRFTNTLEGIGNAAQNVLKQVTSNLKSMQSEVRANVLLQIAASLALLAGAIFLLSKTDPAHLAAAMLAVSIMLGELVFALKQLEKKLGKGMGSKLIAVSIAMGLMAVAIAAMAGAVYLFSLMNFKDMQKGMLGVTEAIALLTGAAVLLSKGGAGANMIGAALGLLIMSAALVALVGAIEVYSRIDSGTLTSGLIKIGASIVVLALSMNLMRTGVGGAAAMFIVSAALVVLSKALNEFAKMSKGDITKALITMGGALLILVVAMDAMEGGLLGAAALLVMVGALTVLVPVLIALASLSWETVGKGLLFLVASMLAIALVAGAIAPVVPVLLGLGAAVALIGAAVFLAGNGVLALALGLALLSKNGTAGFAALKDIIMDFLHSLPEMIDAFGATIDAIANLIGDKAPELVQAFSDLIGNMLDAATKNIPKFGKFISALIKAGLHVLVSYYSDLANAGLDLLLNLIGAFRTHIDRIVTAATDLIITFVNSLARNGVRLANAGLQALIDFLNGLADAIKTHSTQINNAGARVAVAIISGVTQPIRQAGQQILDALQAAWNYAKDHFVPHLSVGGHKVFRSDPNVLIGVFAQLVGGADQVNTALDSIQSKIKDTLQKSGEDIKKYNTKIQALKKSGAAAGKIKAVQDLLDTAKAAQKDAKKDLQQYQQILKSQGGLLKQYAKDYDKLMSDIKNASDDLDAATQAQTDFKASVMATFGTLPDIQAGQSLSSYMNQLKVQQAKVEKFKATLAALRAAGLDDASYQQFLTEGTDAQKIMEQLLAGGSGAIINFEAQNQALQASAQGLADMASATLKNSKGITYDDAVKTAQLYLDGLVNGLGDKKGLQALKDAMTTIAKKMMKAIQDELQQHSPSRKAAEVGFFFVKGLVNQMDDMHGDVEKSSKALANVALDTLQSTLSRVGAGISNELSMSPIITPVLDLTKLTRDAAQISSLLGASPIRANVSFAQASDISASQRATAEDQDNEYSKSPRQLIFEQTLISPTPIDDVKHYRQTKGLLSFAKEVLNV